MTPTTALIRPRKPPIIAPRVVRPFQKIDMTSTGRLHDAAMAKASPTMKATFTNRPARNTQCGLSLGNRVPWRERYQLSVTEATGSVVTELVCASGSECRGQFCSQRSEYCRILNRRNFHQQFRSAPLPRHRGGCSAAVYTLRSSEDRRSVRSTSTAPGAISPGRPTDGCDQSAPRLSSWSTALLYVKGFASCDISFRTSWLHVATYCRPVWSGSLKTSRRLAAS